MVEAYHGILNLDKPAGWTSHDVVAKVRRILQQRSVGHAGTLDPLATGVLLVCVGQATRVAEYLMNSEKVYRATARLGATTDTYDSTGAITSTNPVPELAEEELRDLLARFVGQFEQLPPAYSAIKQGGVALHRRARRGESVELRPRPVAIHQIDLIAWNPPDLTIEVRCGPGTYIRSLAHDLGQLIGSGAHLTALTRLRSGNFALEQAATLEELAAAAAEGQAGRSLHPLRTALEQLTAVPVDAEEIARLAQGQPIHSVTQPVQPEGYAVDADGSVVAILAFDADASLWRPRKVFHSLP